METTSPVIKTPFIWIAISALFFFLTQTWKSFDEGIHHVFAVDSYSYLAIARAAPHLPTELLPSYHAQRFVIHYFIGLVSYVTHLPVEWVYREAVAGLTFGVLHIAFKILTRLNTNTDLKVWLLSAFILNPYTFRYYWIVSPMLTDLVFVYSLGILVLALMENREKWIYLGVFLGALARQNEILILPGLWFGICYLPKWKSKSLGKKCSLCLSTGLITIIVFKGSLFLSRSFSSPDVFPFQIMYSVIPWLFSPDFQWTNLITHSLKSVIPYFAFLALLVGVVLKSKKTSWFRVELAYLFLMIGGLVAGAFLPSPFYQQKSESRYASFGILLAVIFISYIWQFRKNIKFKKFAQAKTAYIFAILALALGSLHHLYTSIGPKTVEQFTVLQIFTCFILALSFNQCLDSAHD